MVKIQILIRLIIYNKKLTKKELMTIVINTCQLMTKMSNNKTEIKNQNKAKQKYLKKFVKDKLHGSELYLITTN